ncbi:MAG TPA: hypothetical protein VN611_16240 [Patescibacteria group bacterium]|nr:hypothetical protein [Patescibacteria group bacterium]
MKGSPVILDIVLIVVAAFYFLLRTPQENIGRPLIDSFILLGIVLIIIARLNSRFRP